MQLRTGRAGQRRMLAAAAAAVTAATVAACGPTGGVDTGAYRGSPPPTARPTSAGASSAMPTAGKPARLAIKENWLTVFSTAAAPSLRAAMLQHGQRFTSFLRAQARSGPAESAKVTGITLTSPARATVKYRLLRGGKAARGTRTGTAVYRHGRWKVSDTSFCGVLGSGGAGTPPAACH